MQLVTFIVFNITIVAFSLYLNYIIPNDDPNETTLWDTINHHNINIRSILIGGVFGFVFGFIDNFFLVIGIDNLTKYMPGDTITQSGLGNTYSDVVASLVGVFVSNAMHSIMKTHDEKFPLWADSMGILLGCLFGLYVGKLFIKYKKK